MPTCMCKLHRVWKYGDFNSKILLKTILLSIQEDEVDGMDSYDEEDKSPFDDLFLWAILTKKFELASLMWQRGRQSIAKALIGSRLCFKMSEIARAKYNTDAADLIMVECRFVFFSFLYFFLFFFFWLKYVITNI